MLYHLYETQRSLMEPFTDFAQAASKLLSNPGSPLSQTGTAQRMAAAYGLLYRLGKDYEKPAFGIHTVYVDGVGLAIHERVEIDKPFCALRRFKRFSDDRATLTGLKGQPVVLIVAPLSGHYASLLRDTVRTMLREHKVYITDWKNARMVPLSEGPFHLDDYVNYMQEFIRHLQAKYGHCHVVSVCQPTVPVLAAVSLMARRGEQTPLTMTMMGGTIDARKSPTAVNNLAINRSFEWFENNVIYRVPEKFPGAGRRVYPGFLQYTGFVAMNPDRHASSHYDYFKNLVKGDDASAEAHRNFYDEYNAVLDMDADYYLETIQTVFQDYKLVHGTWDVRSPEDRIERVRPQDITSTALFTVEGELDDISGSGQTEAAHGLCSGIAHQAQRHLEVKGAGHYGIFSGRRWRDMVSPQVRAFILGPRSPPKNALAPAPAAAAPAAAEAPVAVPVTPASKAGSEPAQQTAQTVEAVPPTTSAPRAAAKTPAAPDSHALGTAGAGQRRGRRGRRAGRAGHGPQGRQGGGNAGPPQQGAQGLSQPPAAGALADLAARIDAALPQTQCTRCGYPDCRAYAQAIAEGAAAIDQCPPGGAEGVARLAAITGQTALALNARHGSEGPRSVAFIDEDWCIGCTLCLKVCPTDAIVGASKMMHTIIERYCTGCELCLPVCPPDSIPLDTTTHPPTPPPSPPTAPGVICAGPCAPWTASRWTPPAAPPPAGPPGPQRRHSRRASAIDSIPTPCPANTHSPHAPPHPAALPLRAAAPALGGGDSGCGLQPHQPGHGRAAPSGAAIGQGRIDRASGGPGPLPGHRRRAATARGLRRLAPAALRTGAGPGPPVAPGERLARSIVRVRPDRHRPLARPAVRGLPEPVLSNLRRRCAVGRGQTVLRLQRPGAQLRRGLGRRASQRLAAHATAVSVLAGQPYRRRDAAGRVAKAVGTERAPWFRHRLGRVLQRNLCP